MTGSATGAINGRLATGTLTQSKLTGPLDGELSLSLSEHDKEWKSVRERSHNPKSKWGGTWSDIIICNCEPN
jgi:hypothetical protein